LNHTWINNYRKAMRRPAECLTGEVGDYAIPGAAHSRLASAELEALELMGDEEVREAFAQLPEAQRMAVFYADVEGLRYKEIAEILVMPLGSVMSRVHRGRRNMRKLLMDFAIERGYLRRENNVEVAA
jgi:RNA polymerase sigma-70 factor, ECF subfamily